VLASRGIASVVMHQRGCSGEPNRMARFYHAGETDDLRVVLAHLRRTLPARRILAVGYSLGGNILLKWLGQAPDPMLDAAAAVSVPFRLDDGARRLETGLSRIYQHYLLRAMKRSVARKRQRMPHPVDPRALAACRTFEQIDTTLTAALHGFRDAADYYARSSCRQFLGSIRTPTLIIHSADDPFMSPAAVPEEWELPARVRLELSQHGGHCGFVGGPFPLRPRYWLDERLAAFILSAIAQTA
ncbi:MAG: YheT family hydrolase, partial [Wenzhouxiangella sp.]